MKTQAEKVFITQSEAMQILCIESRTQMERLRNKGVITAYKPFGRVLYKRDEIIGLIEQSRIQTIPEPVSITVNKKKKNKGYEPYDSSRDWLRRQVEARNEVRA